MDETIFKGRLHELISEIEKLPAPQQELLKDLANETKTQQEQLAATARTIAEAMDYLRLQIKYMVFDLEATRRENRYLRKMLESRPSNPNFDPGEDPSE
jgi:hypothetical protein